MPTKDNIFSANRECMIRFVKEAGQYIFDNAEDLVGDMRNTTGFDVVLRVDINSAPTVTLERRITTGGWDGKREVFKYGERLGE